VIDTGIYIFEHNGFECEIIERPDKAYCKQAFGRKGDLIWRPNTEGRLIYFDMSLTFEQIEVACITMLDTGGFKGTIERYGDMLVCVEIE